MPKAIRQPSVDIVQFIAFQLAADTMNWNEPIPQFETRYPNVLERCIITPFQKFNQRSLYQGLAGKGAILFYLLIKNHPFQNGNKRIAVTTLFVFLAMNDKWLRVDKTKLYNVALWVAESPPEAMTETVSYLEKFIKKNIINVEILTEDGLLR